MSKHTIDLVRRLRDPSDNGYIGEAGQSVRCCAASYIENLSPVAAKYLTAAIARPLDEWHEDYGDVLWWNFPIVEPPYIGAPIDREWPGGLTHWTPLIVPDRPNDE